MGAEGPVPGDSRASGVWRRRARTLRPRAPRAGPDAQGEEAVGAGVYGFWPANADGDDIIVYKDDARRVELARFHMLRQQDIIADGRPNRSLADFVAPRASQAPDYIGVFAVTAGIGADELAAEYEREHDDYSAIIVKALADRLAEAFAEFLHAQARRDWGYAKDERLSNDELIDEEYRGIRPAFGYPACPDHTEKGTIFTLLDAPADRAWRSPSRSR